ncbi:conserved phage C-terminal domain-containing protein [Fructilactobacillus frigidiflavus]|uniref:conserved phage C-terminal domain-containing protein n=1 Tax=Fructilactobacillus frigidiflavus TaxID=3242688 RepID=UPI0037569A5F
MAKIKKNYKRGYTVTDNQLIEDDRLSWKARGVFTYLWAQSEDWDFYELEVTKHAPDGRDSLRSALKELEKHGYLKRKMKRNKGNFSKYDWILSDTPMLDYPTSEEPTSENPTSDNPTLTSTKEISTNKTNTNSNKNMSSSVEHDDISAKVIDYLNEKADRHFRKTAANKRLINARVKEGFELKDFKRAIDTKTAQWAKDTKMSKYLRPVTLFNTSKFEGYVNEQQLPQGTNANRGLNVRETLPDWAQEGYEYQPKQKVTADDIKLEEGELPF